MLTLPPSPLAGKSRSCVLPLQLERVSFEHRGQLLLDEISLVLDRSGKTLLLGPNGAGKSLLMRLCLRLLTPTKGHIRWLGAPTATPAELRQAVAMVFQRPVLLRRSTAANLDYALAVQGLARRERRRRTEEALERFGLAALAGRPARVLSGGEQQRLALARAWAQRPQVLFLDEPTSALDPAACKAVEDAVEAFHAAGTRIVMSSHDLGQARRLADEVVFLCGGRLLEHTPADQFFTKPATPEADLFIRGGLVW